MRWKKRWPHYDLDAIKRAIGTEERLSITATALRDAGRLNFGRKEVASLIQSITRKMFYKSMTRYKDARMWQDVYHVPSGNFLLYVKFQADVLTEFSVVSFKEK